MQDKKIMRIQSDQLRELKDYKIVLMTAAGHNFYSYLLITNTHIIFKFQLYEMTNIEFVYLYF